MSAQELRKIVEDRAVPLGIFAEDNSISRSTLSRYLSLNPKQSRVIDPHFAAVIRIKYLGETP
jgi:hypothetical protein